MHPDAIPWPRASVGVFLNLPSEAASSAASVQRAHCCSSQRGPGPKGATKGAMRGNRRIRIPKPSMESMEITKLRASPMQPDLRRTAGNSAKTPYTSAPTSPITIRQFPNSHPITPTQAPGRRRRTPPDGAHGDSASQARSWRGDQPAPRD
ncbi:hypothetical protein EJ06DRAFT_148614 [Trichodelitschia bisporula]|uniref:Uncharacterized protein n=1 Tax=Trichodelitschia bisporula TaxID=703511 RepID=A0A6G1HMX2_9PEZI|nr:hypothetical protein EJ06DRAFT_148614 [Trichodelitschia bisporula]